MPEVHPDRARSFMWAVQTGIIAYARPVRRKDTARDKAVEYPGSGTFIVMDEAVREAGLIPRQGRRNCGA
jgi:hypothetical protein